MFCSQRRITLVNLKLEIKVDNFSLKHFAVRNHIVLDERFKLLSIQLAC